MAQHGHPSSPKGLLLLIVVFIIIMIANHETTSRHVASAPSYGLQIRN